MASLPATYDLTTPEWLSFQEYWENVFVPTAMSSEDFFNDPITVPLEMIAFIICGFSESRKLKIIKGSNMYSKNPWIANSNKNKQFVSFKMKKDNFLFEVKVTTMTTGLFLIIIHMSIHHRISKIEITKNLHISFKLPPDSSDSPDLFKYYLQYKKLAQIQYKMDKEFIEIWKRHALKITDLSTDENEIRNRLYKIIKQQWIPNSFEISRLTEMNQFKHVYMALLCHVIIDYCCEQQNTFQKSKNDMITQRICANLINCIRRNRTFNHSYSVHTLESNSKYNSKSIRVRYIPMMSVCLLLVDDSLLESLNIKCPRLQCNIDQYIHIPNHNNHNNNHNNTETNAFEFTQLSGDGGLIERIAKNIVHRSFDPFFQSKSAQLIALPVICLENVFSFLHFSDLVHFGLCSSLSSDLSHLFWKCMCAMEFPKVFKANQPTTKDWKSLFCITFLETHSSSKSKTTQTNTNTNTNANANANANAYVPITGRGVNIIWT